MMLGVWYLNGKKAFDVPDRVPCLFGAICGWRMSEQFRSYCHWLGREGENV
jgi:hypothetical protein